MSEEKKKGRAGRPAIKRTISGFPGRLASALRAMRGTRTMTEVSEATGGIVSPDLWCRYESGTIPGFDRLLAICFALGKRPEDLLPKSSREMLRSPKKHSIKDFLKALE